MEAVAPHAVVNMRVILHYVDLENLDRGADVEVAVPIRPDVQRTLRLAACCREMEGFHFDVLQVGKEHDDTGEWKVDDHVQGMRVDLSADLSGESVNEMRDSGDKDAGTGEGC